MKTPMILPWVAHKAGLSEAEARALWQRAQDEAATLCQQRDGGDFASQALERLLTLAKIDHDTLPRETTGTTDQAPCPPCFTGVALPAAYAEAAPNMSWIWGHQGRMAQFGLTAAVNATKFWQDTWNGLFKPYVRFGS